MIIITCITGLHCGITTESQQQHLVHQLFGITVSTRNHFHCCARYKCVCVVVSSLLLLLLFFCDVEIGDQIYENLLYNITKTNTSLTNIKCERRILLQALG